MSNGDNTFRIAGRTLLRITVSKMQNTANNRKMTPTSDVKSGYERRQNNDNKGYEKSRK